MIIGEQVQEPVHNLKEVADEEDGFCNKFT